VVDSEGSLSLCDCVVTGGPGSLPGGQLGLPAPGGAGLGAYNCASVTLSSCTVAGGPGNSTAATDGGTGLFVSSAAVTFVQTSVEGGAGGGDSSVTLGGAGGSGVDIELGSVFIGAL